VEEVTKMITLLFRR